MPIVAVVVTAAPPSWSYCRHASHHAASSRQYSHRCRVTHGGAPCCNNLPDGKPPVGTTTLGAAGGNGGGRQRRQRRWGGVTGLRFDLPFFCLRLPPTPFQRSSALAIEYMNSYKENEKRKDGAKRGLLYGTDLNSRNSFCDVIFSLMRKICYTQFINYKKN